MLNNIKVGTRLLGSFLIIALLGSAVAAIGIFNMSTMNEQAELAYDRELLGLSYTKQANIDLIGMGRAARGVLLADTPEAVRLSMAQVEQSRRQLHDNLDQSRRASKPSPARKSWPMSTAASPNTRRCWRS
ncbi:MCP four helix bundle domain-containing protein [Massilia pseudoviolaceinigra]|uniref:MCP four helix bundle domain-containing protein n=1 Tax=Massilia pseudoviolaceinigra TaxID=3057165 RepID=UPI0035B4FACA